MRSTELRTIDVPDLSSAFSPESEPPWRWLDDDWPYRDQEPPVAARSLALTDLDALRGAPLHEVARSYEDNVGTEWECWASSADPIPREHQRVVPFGLFLAVDPTVGALTDLDEGEWATRSPPSLDWQKWSA